MKQSKKIPDLSNNKKLETDYGLKYSSDQLTALIIRIFIRHREIFCGLLLLTSALVSGQFTNHISV